MFGIGATELIVIMVVALLVFGPKRLPELARSLGRGMAEFRRASSDLRQTLQEAEPPADILKPPETPSQSIAPSTAPSDTAGVPRFRSGRVLSDVTLSRSWLGLFGFGLFSMDWTQLRVP